MAYKANTPEWLLQNKGLPQKFPLLTEVKVKQDGSAPEDWCYDWADTVLIITGVAIDTFLMGRVCYYVVVKGNSTREHDAFAEDWLEEV